MMAHPIVAMSPVENKPAGLYLKDIISTVDVGDTLVCTSSITIIEHVGKVFTEGKEYPVITGDQLFTQGMTTIRDDNDVEVPIAHGSCMALYDTFVVKTTPVLEDLEMPTPFGELDLFSRKEILDAWKAGMPILHFAGNEWYEHGNPMFAFHDAYKVGKTDTEIRIEEIESELKDLTESRDSILDRIREVNTFSGGTVWKDMSREEKATLLLASSEGKAIQFKHAHHEFDRTWKAVDPLWVSNGFYRVEPECLAVYDEELDELNNQIDALREELHDLESGDLDW